jgi:YVTN family beta-propeller protein
MTGIFLSYRRDDSAGWAGRLYEHLVEDWGPGPVFMDIDAIRPGEDFRESITRTLHTCDVVLVVIGPNWLSARDEAGNRRLDDPGDTHRTEVAAALAADVLVVPVLVGGADMPKLSELPKPLKDLAYRHAAIIEDRRFVSDVNSLQEALEQFAESLVAKRVAEVEAARVAREEEARRVAEVEAARVAREEEARRVAEVEAARVAQEEEAPRAAEVEAARVAQEEEAPRAAEVEAARVAQEEEARHEADRDEGDSSGRRRRLIAAAVIAALALAVGASVAVFGGDGGDAVDAESDTTTTTTTTTSATGLPAGLDVTDQIDLGPGPDGVVFDEDGQMWVAAIGDGAGAGDRLWRVDPADPGSAEGYDRGKDPLAVTFAEGHVWVTMRLEGTTLRIDPSTGEPVEGGVIPTPGQPEWVSAGAGSIWVAAGTDDASTVYRIDPATNTVVAQSETITAADAVVVDDQGRVWISYGANMVGQFDMDLNPVGEPIIVGEDPDALALGAGSIWVCNRGEGTVSRIDPDNRAVVDTIQVGGAPAAIAVDGTRVWVADRNGGRLVVIDANDTQQTLEAAVGGNPLGLAVRGDDVWVTRSSLASVVKVTARS